MAAIQDLVLTFCSKMRCLPQRKLKLLMPVYVRKLVGVDLIIYNSLVAAN